MTERNLKIAYIIVAHKEPEQFSRLIHRLDSDFCTFYIHIDKKVDPFPFKEVLNDISPQKIHFIKQFDASWGEFGIVEAEIEALRQILKSDSKFDLAILLSGQDYPIKSNDYIYKFFLENKGKSFIDIRPMPFKEWPDGGMHRLDHYYFNMFDQMIIYPPKKKPKKRWKKILFFFMRMYLPKRSFPQSLKPYGGEHWWSLSIEAIAYILKFIDKNPEVIKFYKRSICSDEMFFHTILGNSEFWGTSQVLNPDHLRLIDWSEDKDHPRFLDISDLEDLKKSQKLFARKFSFETGNEVLDHIDEYVV